MFLKAAFWTCSLIAFYQSTFSFTESCPTHQFQILKRYLIFASENLAVRIRMYLHNEIDICMYLMKNTAIYLDFFNVSICKYVSICMYHMYLHVSGTICMYMHVWMYMYLLYVYACNVYVFKDLSFRYTYIYMQYIHIHAINVYTYNTYIYIDIHAYTCNTCNTYNSYIDIPCKQHVHMRHTYTYKYIPILTIHTYTCKYNPSMYMHVFEQYFENKHANTFKYMQ